MNAEDEVMLGFGLEAEEELVVPEAKIWEEEGKTWAFCFDGPSRKFVPVEVRFQKSTGYWVRQDTYDRDSIKECLANYTHLKCQGKRVLDLGANIGGFTRIAYDQGAALVVSVEPCPYNHSMVVKNSPQTQNLWGGAVAGDEADVEFYYTDSKRNAVSSSTTKRRNSTEVMLRVPAFSFSKLLEQHRFQVLKMDIEGGEYDLLDSIGAIPPFVEQAAFEFHRGSEPFASYPERFFPKDSWEWFEEPAGRFASLREITFHRRGI